LQELPRDTDGYIDLERIDDVDTSLDLSQWGSPPPLQEETWQGIVDSAPHTDPASLGTDLNELVGGSAAEAGMIPGPWEEAEEASSVDADADLGTPSWDASSSDQDVDQAPDEGPVHETHLADDDQKIEDDDLGF
jgi:hypothetical protein